MAASIKRETGCEAELVRGDRGIFDVVADGALIYSKHQTGRFPEDDEILGQLRGT